ncbi:MAG: SsrA-binding protein SmpB [Clostridia bacterium]|nr:SsrA-binding protein SmpB [Clostridia bacterium]
MGSEKTGDSAGEKLVASNRKARHEYFIEETYEAGISLTGTEIQSVRRGRVSLGDAYAEVRGGEMFLVNSHISEWDYGNRLNHDPLRPRRLLLHKHEITRLDSRVREKGYTIIPLRMYLVRGLAKVEIGLARGKKLWDKREDIAKRDADREIERASKSRGRE